jgi:hypothetical protein
LSKNRQADRFTWRFPSACLPGIGVVAERSRSAAPMSLGKGNNPSSHPLRQSIANRSLSTVEVPVLTLDSWRLALS